MIKKALFLLFISFNYIFANTLILNDNTNYSNLTSKNFQKTFIDKSANLIIDEIVKNNLFKKIEKSNFKASKNTIWTKLSIKNLSSKDLKLYFENNRPIIDIIDVYIFKNEKAYRKVELGENRDIKKRELETRKSTFSLQLERNSKYTIYIMYKSYTSISTFWKIENQYNYISSSTLESLSWGIFIGIIITLILYNFSVYFTIKENYFLIYIALSIFIALYQLKINGYYFQFFSHYNLKWTNNINWTLGFLTQTFILLFPFSFFKPKKNTFIYKMLLGLIIINVFFAIFYLGALKYDNIKLFTKYTDILAFTTIPALFIVSVWAIINKLTGSLFYFLGQFNFLLLAFYGALVNFGYFEPISNMGIIIPLGIILDVIFISLALFSKVKNIKKEKKENEQLLISQSRFTTMGQNIATLVHQWKNPISQLGSEILLLKAIYSLDKSKFENTFKETMPKIEDSIKFLNNTMNDIYNFYKNPNEEENFIIENEIDSLLRLIDSKLVFNNIKIVKDCDDISIKGYKTSLLNIVLSILENSIYELSNKRNNNKKIFITLKDLKDNIMLLIEDNAGGIKSNDFDKLFTINYSSKGTNGSGVGLALTKRLVESRLNGTITASNTKHGAVFKIIFPKGS